MVCPGDLYYNPELEICDFSFNVPDCIEGTRAPIAGSTVTTQRTTTEESSSSTSTEEPITEEPTKPGKIC